MQDKVTRLRQLMSEAIPRAMPAAHAANEEAWRAYQLYEYNTALPLEQSPRDLSIRLINRVAMRYNWPRVVQDYLDAQGQNSLHLLNDSQIEELRLRMERLELCAQTGCDDADAPPAR